MERMDSTLKKLISDRIAAGFMRHLFSLVVLPCHEKGRRAKDRENGDERELQENGCRKGKRAEEQSRWIEQELLPCFQPHRERKPDGDGRHAVQHVLHRRCRAMEEVGVGKCQDDQEGDGNKPKYRGDSAL